MELYSQALNSRKNSLDELEEVCNFLRFKTIENSYIYKIPHLGSCLSPVEIIVALYWSILNIDPSDPASALRDRFVLSKGHAAPLLFQILACRGFFSSELLDDYGSDGSIFGEHPPAPSQLPGIEAATGALGHGLPIALGFALSSKILEGNFRSFALLGDGECNEGTIWESAQIAAAQKCGNLIVIVDHNGWQATDKSANTLGVGSLVGKWEAFGWQATEIDGNSMQEVIQTLRQVTSNSCVPTAIIANTVKGKGVSFMENDNNWHYRTPDDEEFIKASSELGISDKYIESAMAKKASEGPQK